jgi:hypothetical protein
VTTNVAALRRLIPDWFIRTVTFGSTSTPWRDSVRSAVTVPAVAGVGYAIGGPGAALFSSLSALLIVLSERSGTTGQRTLRSGCALAGGTLAMIFGPGSSYWIVLTVALCFKPDFASVFSRTLQRGIGTGLGVVIGWGATFFAAGYSVLPILAVLCAAIPWAVRRNYWAFSVIITPLVLLLLDYGGTVGPDVLLQRLVNTATGCAVVLIAGYALVPATWWPPVDRERQRVEADLARVTAAGPTASLADRSLQRAAIGSALQAMRDRAAQANGEPRPIRVRALQWARVADCLEERLVAASGTLAGGTTPDGGAPTAECRLRRGDGPQA